MENKPKVGIAVMIFKNGKVLLAKRKNAHGEGEHAFPGGHLEFGESFEDCARRETREEVGIEIQNVRFLYLANLTHYVGKHYAQIGLMADWKSGQPEALEPEKSEAWEWFEIDKVPAPVFETAIMSFKAYKTGQQYYDSTPALT
jgi:8-oxo-dGTP diphosphatase